MPAFSYELRDLRKEIAATQNEERPFGELFIRIEATYRTSREVEEASITGMSTFSIVSKGHGFTIVGEGMAALQDLDAGQDAFIVRAKLKADGNFAGARTLDVVVTDENGTTYSYGSSSSRTERFDKRK